MKVRMDKGFLAGLSMSLRLLLAGSMLPGPVVAQGNPDTGFELTYPVQRVPAPAFSLPDLAGQQPVSVAGLTGHLVLVHFWATFCEPCRREMPELESLWQKYRARGLIVVGVAADRDSTEPVRRFVEQTGVSFPVVQDRTGLVRADYEVAALPTTYLIGQDGRILARAIGMRDWNGAQGRASVAAMLDSMITAGSRSQ